jgi:hypothetical protein
LNSYSSFILNFSNAFYDQSQIIKVFFINRHNQQFSVTVDEAFNMKRNFKSCLNIFYFFGLSLKTFVRSKTWRENWLSIWSILIFGFYAVDFFFAFFTLKPIGQREIIKFIVRTTSYATNICCFTTLFSIVLNDSDDDDFWEYTEELKEIFEFLPGINVDYKKHNQQIRRRALASLCVFGLGPLLFTAVSSTTENSRTVGVVAYIPIFFLRIYNVKFSFYADILALCLETIEQATADPGITVDEIRVLKKAYSKCWLMCCKINDIFGFGLVASTIMAIMGSLYVGYLLTFVIKAGNFPFVFLSVTFSYILGILVMSLPCQRCINASAAIGSNIHIKSVSEDFKKIAEAFDRQMFFQVIEFRPQYLFTIDHKLAVKVCNLIKIECEFKSIKF